MGHLWVRFALALGGWLILGASFAWVFWMITARKDRNSGRRF